MRAAPGPGRAAPARAHRAWRPRAHLTSVSLGAGYTWLSTRPAGTRRRAEGVALDLHVRGRTSPRLGFGLALTWGLTDWDRAGEWVRAGNDAGRWTTDRFADVEAWVRAGKRDQTGALRLLGAVFADAFLALSYAAVPICYAGSVGGATSHLQVDVTASVHLAERAPDVYVEMGLGAAGLPVRLGEWNDAFGPVVGAGVVAGPVRIGGRVLVSPPALNRSGLGTIVIGAVTLGAAG